MPRVPVDSDSAGFEGDSDARFNHATSPAVAESGSYPEDHISDWGDFEGDHTSDSLSSANGSASERDEEGTGYASPSEVETYYDSFQPEDIKIRER